MQPVAAAHALIHSVNSHIRTNVNRTISFVETGQAQTRPNPFHPKEFLVLEPISAARTLQKRLAELGVNNDPQLLDALRSTLAEHLHLAFFELFTALDGESAIYAEDNSEAHLELRVLDGAPLPGCLHEFFTPADLS